MENEKLIKAKRLIEKGARAWERGNNSGSNEILTQQEAKSEKHYNDAEKLIKDVYPNIEIDYPGLYPSFKINGAWFYTLESLEFHVKI